MVIRVDRLTTRPFKGGIGSDVQVREHDFIAVIVHCTSQLEIGVFLMVGLTPF